MKTDLNGGVSYDADANALLDDHFVQPQSFGRIEDGGIIDSNEVIVTASSANSQRVNRANKTDSLQVPNLEMTLNGQGFTQLVLPDGRSFTVFSGAEGHFNNPASTSLGFQGPLPKGEYYIVKRSVGWREYFTGDGSKDNWLALYKKDDKVDDVTSFPVTVMEKGADKPYTVTEKRSAFRMHAGTDSAGCITFKGESGKVDFDAVRKYLIDETANGKIPGTDTTYYGTVTVK